jgi:hypothetical protein
MKLVSRHFSAICYLLIMFLIMLIDGMTGIYVSLWILYFIPVGLATWNLGRGAGLCMAAVALILQVATAAIWGHLYSGWGYLSISCLSKFASYLVLVFLVAGLRKREVERVFARAKA